MSGSAHRGYRPIALRAARVVPRMRARRRSGYRAGVLRGSRRPSAAPRVFPSAPATAASRQPQRAARSAHCRRGAVSARRIAGDTPLPTHRSLRWARCRASRSAPAPSPRSLLRGACPGPFVLPQPRPLFPHRAPILALVSRTAEGRRAGREDA